MYSRENTRKLHVCLLVPLQCLEEGINSWFLKQPSHAPLCIHVETSESACFARDKIYVCVCMQAEGQKELVATQEKVFLACVMSLFPCMNVVGFQVDSSSTNTRYQKSLSLIWRDLK